METNVTDLILLTPTKQMKTYAKTELELLEREERDPLEFAKAHHEASVQMVKFRSVLDHLQITGLSKIGLDIKIRLRAMLSH